MRGITDTMTNQWKRTFGGMQVSDAKPLRQLEEENCQLNGLWPTGR